jgi:hypothetical protein
VTICGDDVAEGSELCDGVDLGGATCVSQGFAAGTLACSPNCASYDTSGCTSGGVDCCTAHLGTGCGTPACESAICGADTFCCDTEWDDVCANAAAAEPSCFGAGTCPAAPVCGDGVIGAGEACDGMLLGGEDCLSLGFASGTLACDASCAFDTSGCVAPAADCCEAHAGTGCQNPTCEQAICAADPFCCNNTWDSICANAADVNPACVGAGGTCPGGAGVCGDGAVNSGESCDGANLNGQTCQSQGFTGGTLSCNANCGFDTTGCTGNGADCCEAHAGTGCQNPTCEQAICAADPFCCNNTWDSICANAADVSPACVGAGGTCPGSAPVCGDGAVTGTESCDGANLNGQTCQSQGFTGGTLACDAMCGFDTTGCTSGGPDCCTAHAGTGCQNATCQQAICAADPFCCNNTWDDICANAADTNPACVGAGGTCPTAAVCGNGTLEGSEPCDGANLNGQTCQTQGFASGTLACNGTCSGFVTSGCSGQSFPCQDQDLGSSIGMAVLTGSTTGDDNDINPTCGGGDANDRVIRFVAPAAGTYTFSTDGSSFDTVLTLHQSCTTQLACDDDSGLGTQSLLSRVMTAGEVVLIVIDGYNGATGNFVLNITSP